jgi:hypothetical protein
MLAVANLALSFFLELCLLAALGYWGFRAGVGTLPRFILGIGAPLLAAALWGLFLAPKSNRRLRGLPFDLLKLMLFGLAVLALYVAGQPILALVFGLIVILNRVLVHLLKQAALS